MIAFKFLMMLFLYSTVLVGCQTPFIDIDIDTGAGTAVVDPAQAACWPGFSACPAKKPNVTVTDIVKISDTAKLYMVKKGELAYQIFSPPATVVPANLAKDSKVTIELSDGIYTITKQNE